MSCVHDQINEKSWPPWPIYRCATHLVGAADFLLRSSADSSVVMKLVACGRLRQRGCRRGKLPPRDRLPRAYLTRRKSGAAGCPRAPVTPRPGDTHARGRRPGRIREGGS